MKKLCGRFPVAGLFLLLLVLCGCRGLVNGTATTTTNAPPPANLQSINHIIFMAQENRSLDTYFGQLPAYWAANGYPSQPFNGMSASASDPTLRRPGTVAAFPLAPFCTSNLGSSSM